MKKQWAVALFGGPLDGLRLEYERQPKSYLAIQKFNNITWHRPVGYRFSRSLRKVLVYVWDPEFDPEKTEPDRP